MRHRNSARDQMPLEELRLLERHLASLGLVNPGRSRCGLARVSRMAMHKSRDSEAGRVTPRSEAKRVKTANDSAVTSMDRSRSASVEAAWETLCMRRRGLRESLSLPISALSLSYRQARRLSRTDHLKADFSLHGTTTTLSQDVGRRPKKSDSGFVTVYRVVMSPGEAFCPLLGSQDSQHRFIELVQ